MFSSSSCSNSCVSRIFDMTCYNSIFIIIMFIAYVDYMFSIVRVICVYAMVHIALILMIKGWVIDIV